MSRRCFHRLRGIGWPEARGQARSWRRRSCAACRSPSERRKSAAHGRLAADVDTRLGVAYARAPARAFRQAAGDHASVVLRHSRIYMVPTRRGWAMILTLFVLLLTSLNYALALGIGVTFLFTGLLAAAQLHTFRNLAGIEITRWQRARRSPAARSRSRWLLHAGFRRAHRHHGHRARTRGRAATSWQGLR